MNLVGKVQIALQSLSLFRRQMVQAIPAQRISEDSLFFNRIVAGLANPVRAVVHLFERQIDLLEQVSQMFLVSSFGESTLEPLASVKKLGLEPRFGSRKHTVPRFSLS